MSVATVFVFRYIALNPLYQQISQLSYYFVPALIAIPLLILLFYLFAPHLNSGLPHVVLEFHIGLGRLPFLNFIFQFLSASVALLMGFAVGAIGPAVHIGATSANLVGQFFQVRSHSLRILTACGASVAITIMLDTPLMAILFTYETIIRQFRWRTLALVSAATVFAQWFGHQMDIAPFHIYLIPFELSASLLGLLLLFGLICGLISAFFLNSIDYLTHKIRLTYWKKITIAGLITAIFSTLSPTTIGLGYQLLQSLLYEKQLLSVLLLWFFIRFVGSMAVIALAIPGGALGPSLVLGALSGAIFSQILSIEAGQLFMIIGMGALLGATLRVPLAGILFVLESTNEISLLLPCVIASYSAFYLHQRFSKHNNLIELLLFRQKVILRDSPSLMKKRLTSPL
ncbi:MAG: chloride channel protein [Psychromonas sp.]|nr:chloride channel protein [Alteromonadales bacterium]MCP5078752.1 chloride channel protein [Psychromonas sp.]